MRLLAPQQRAAIRPLLTPDRPGPTVGLHVLHSGHGACFADRWPQPRALFSVAGPNYSLAGDPAAFDAAELVPHIAGMVDCPPAFSDLLEAVEPGHGHWDRMISQLRGDPTPFGTSGGELRQLGPDDAHHVYGLTDHNSWIAETWGGPAGMCANEMAWGAFVDGDLASVAVSFYVGDRFEDVGVVTEPDHRGRGLSVECAGSLCRDIRARGRSASWSTSPDNIASLRVAEKLGFVHEREDLLHVIGDEIPASAAKDDAHSA